MSDFYLMTRAAYTKLSTPVAKAALRAGLTTRHFGQAIRLDTNGENVTLAAASGLSRQCAQASSAASLSPSTIKCWPLKDEALGAA